MEGKNAKGQVGLFPESYVSRITPRVSRGQYGGGGGVIQLHSVSREIWPALEFERLSTTLKFRASFKK